MARRHVHITRDAVLFVVGIGGIVHEVFFTTGERASLLILFGAMIGLPFAFGADRSKNESGAS